MSTYSLIPHAKDVWMRSPVGIIEFSLGIQPASFPVQYGNRLLVRDTDLVRAISHDWTIFLVQPRKVVWLMESQELIRLPQICDLGQEWSWVFCKRMQQGLIYDINDQG